MDRKGERGQKNKQTHNVKKQLNKSPETCFP